MKKLKFSNSLNKIKEKVYQETIIDKRLSNKIDKEFSHLGKEKILINIIKKNNKDNRNLLYLTLKLDDINKEIYNSIKKEDIKKRVNLKLRDEKILKFLSDQINKAANHHYKLAKTHYSRYKNDKKNGHQHLLKLSIHKTKAERMYEALSENKFKKVINNVLNKKLEMVFREISDYCIELSGKIHKLVIMINKGEKNINKSISEISGIVQNKVSLLEDFAIQYGYKIIHSEEFSGPNNKKLILIEK